MGGDVRTGWRSHAGGARFAGCAAEGLATSMVLVGWLGAWPPLGWAVRHKQLEVARQLLELGASPDAQDRWDRRPLLATAVLRRDATMAELLLAAGADVDACDETGTRSLIHACWQGDLDLVVLLLDHGADPEVTNRAGGHDAVVTLLVAAGAKGSS